MIRPAKCHFDGFIKAFIKGADKNHNPRKGTETAGKAVRSLERMLEIRTIIPARGRKLIRRFESYYPCQSWIRTIIPARGRKHVPGGWSRTLRPCDKNHNPRKGTETAFLQIRMIFGESSIRTIIPARGRKLSCYFPPKTGFSCTVDKNHNPRKGTETDLCAHALLTRELLG